ncbi:MAG: hypothetical protein LUF89_00460 [Ruminococcus sp.]|nr:hypothetical protein [Ruminococcus sp.]
MSLYKGSAANSKTLTALHAICDASDAGACAVLPQPINLGTSEYTKPPIADKNDLSKDT